MHPQAWTHPQTWGLLATLSTFLLCIVVAAILGRFDGTPRTPSVRRLGCIDGLRGYLALGVFVHHFVVTYVFKTTGEWTTSGVRFFSNCGGVGVSLFFMITGFLFVSRLLHIRGESGPVNWRRFYIARIFRLLPLYAACIVVIFAIVFTVGGMELRETPFVLFKRAVQWILLLTPNINLFPNTGVILAVTWTLRYEWLFYLALPLVAWMLPQGNKIGRFFLFLTAVLTAYFFICPVKIPFLGDSSGYFALFWVGGLVAHAYRSEPLKRLARKPLSGVVACIALLTVFFGFDSALDVVPTLLMTLFFFVVALGNSLGGLLERRASVLLGNISYSIYLLHCIALYLAFSVIGPHSLQSATHPLSLWAWLPVVGVLVVLASWLTHRFIEQSGIAFGKKLASNRST